MDHIARFIQYAAGIRDIDLQTVKSANDIPTSFLMEADEEFKCFYGPFEHPSTTARLVIVGLTPGLTQWKNAVGEAQRQMADGSSETVILQRAKEVGAFSGNLRDNLIRLLDSIAINEFLGVSTCKSLFEQDRHLIHTTSVLSHPVFFKGMNYNGQKRISKSSLLQGLMQKYFVSQMRQYRQMPLLLPVGKDAQEALESLSVDGVIDPIRILRGLPHPSGANAERIAYFVGSKESRLLSAKTNSANLDSARSALISQVRGLVTTSAL